ncbi:ABC transporter permease [Paenibacillus darwinianus]|uniref:ABC transporter permease n=1 Tax=Paenibacillus darwinianus TaxID=1380763 RepID=A0A9W5RZT2_9BACL|nr:carbohydrate ABC transporter permease [Paenibacillus darwinianus]EXX84953.1 ABC transporter permease [Paenibacillus darwinianus]EXX86087.1 ABC transporter permease [Paenibacillus darwinianus]EXX87257.1 ABC transporter permease [Paenibacillus darwinianus]
MHKLRLSNLAAYLILILMSVFVLFPFVWTFLTSIKTEVQMFAIPPVVVPDPATLQHYQAIIDEGKFQSFMGNSLTVALVSTVLSLAVGIPASYGFAKYRYRFSGMLFAGVIATRMFPPIVLGVPFFLMMRQLGLINTELALIITYLPLQLTLIIWILEGFFRQLPHEIEEAAEIDGLGTLGKFLKIAVPLSLPAVGVASIFSFLAAWNEFMFALTLTRTQETQTMPVGIAGYVTTFQTFWGKMSATGILYIIPVILFTIIAQKGMIKGLTAGATKE